MTHILSNLPEEYQTTVEIIGDELDDKDTLLTIERICDNILVKFDQINEQSISRTSIEVEKDLYVKTQYKGTCMTCGRYGHKGNNAVTKKVQTYQNVITSTNPDMSIKTVGREPGKKNQ